MSSEQPDTAEFREGHPNHDGYCATCADPFPCESFLISVALDAARAELADFRAEFTVLDEAHSEEMARAEAAEKEVRRLGLVQIDCVTLRTDLHAAEARNAAALAEHYCFPCDCGNPCATYRALTEGTDQ